MKRFALILLLLGVSTAYAQTPVVTQPAGVVSYNLSSTIAVTDTFQSIFLASTGATGRIGCTVINYGAATMWVYFGAIADATKAKSIQLSTGQAVYCNNGGIILKDQVSITGTATQAFFAAMQ